MVALKRESFAFGDDPLRNIHVSGDAKVLQLCLKEDQCIARRRMQESVMMLVMSGSIRIQSMDQSEVLGAAEAVIFEPAQEHTVAALADSVVLLILLPGASRQSSYDRLQDTDLADEDWKEQIVPQLRVLASEHEAVLSTLNGVKEYDLASLDEALKAVSALASGHMEGEETLLFPLLAPYLGGEDVGPIPKLRSEHEAIRAQYRNCKELRGGSLADSGALHALFHAVRQLTDLVVAHMEKEDFHLLPMAGRLLSADEKETFHQAWSARYASLELR